jgi:hypothetical protein
MPFISLYRAPCEILFFGVVYDYFTFHLEFVERCKCSWTVENETWKQRRFQRALQAGNADLPEE